MRKWLGVLAAVLLTAMVMGQGIHKETKAEKEKRMEWWREARLGMFIHWGLYSIPAGTWDGKTNYAEWIREEAHIPVTEYEMLRDQFNPVKFDADAWVKLAHDAGMKYITITTKHHDGFNLFDSPLTDWNIGHTPFKRDIMAEMAAACKKYGVKMCWYHSIMDWHHPDYLPRRSWEVKDRPVDGADFRRFVKYLRDEVTWLLTHYGPIGVMWFDGEWESTWNAKDGDDLYKLCRKLQPNVIVNNRVTVGRGDMDNAEVQAGDFSTPEQFIPPTGLGDVDWETCMTMNDHWGFNSHDTHWKSSKELIQNIVDIASKGGNYLLNIGPRSDGTFPPEAVERLHAIGDWMRVNSQSIYDTKASVFEKLPWGRSTTRRNRNGTTTLYLQIFDWPKNGKLVVPGIGNDPESVYFLTRNDADKSRRLPVHRAGSDLVIDAGIRQSDPICSVLKLTVNGAPIIYKAPVITSPSDMLVDSTTARIDPGSKVLIVRYTLDGSVPTIHSPVYSRPIPIQMSLTVGAASFYKGKRVSPVTKMVFRKVRAKAAVQVAGVESGLTCRDYKGDWDKLPNFSGMAARSTTTASAIDLGGSREENWGRDLEGYIAVPSTGLYEFALTSDDGSKLWIDGEVVVDNDGLHGAATKSGHIALAKGRHAIRVGYFNKTGGLQLTLHWGAPGTKLVPVPGSALSHKRE